jgi:hypothetical protein
MKRVQPRNDRAKRRRAAWPIVVKRLSEPVEAEMFGTAESRLRAVGELTEQCWRLARKSLPTYARHETPVRLARLSSQDDLET